MTPWQRERMRGPFREPSALSRMVAALFPEHPSEPLSHTVLSGVAVGVGVASLLILWSVA